MGIRMLEEQWILNNSLSESSFKYWNGPDGTNTKVKRHLEIFLKE